MSVDSTQTKFFTAQERVKKFGLECTGPNLSDEIVFRPGWAPGGEYIIKLTIRNVSGTLKKFKYKLPTSRYFSMGFPELVTLPPGCFVCYDVIFRPLELGVYEDYISFAVLESHEKGFRIPVRALLSNIIVKAPAGLDFGYCPTNQNTDMYIDLENIGEIDAPFDWDVPFPFTVEPTQGIIPTGEKTNIKITICPTDASVYVSQATCSIGRGVVDAIIPNPLLVTKLSAIGKYAYITVSESFVDFGDVTCGQTVVREVVLQNKSVVPTDFYLVRLDGDHCEEVFTITTTESMIPGQSEIFVTIKYKALAAGCFSEDRYVFRTPGKCDSLLTCRASAVSPAIELRRPDRRPDELEAGHPINAFNFGDALIGKTEARAFSIYNLSDRDVSFGFVSDPDSVFKISPLRGIIRSKNEASIKVTFSPSRPINFYRRVFLLVEDSLPQFVDLMGSGFIRADGEIKEQRPLPLRFAHVQAARNRSVAGIGHLSADELDALNDSRFDTDIDENFFAKVGKFGTLPFSTIAIANPITKSGESTRTLIAVAQEFFISDTDGDSREIVLSKTELEFGFALYNTKSDQMSVSIQNKTNSKVSLCWFIPLVDSGDKNDPSKSAVFTIDPISCDIEAKKSQEFFVHFSSKQSNRNFLTEAEVIIFPKNQRTFRLVNDATMSPPWNLQLRLSGHTFASGQLLANILVTGSSISRGKLTFPSAYIEESIFETIILQNLSNLPAMFRVRAIVADGVSEVFSVKPDDGQIAANGFMHLIVRFNPKAKQVYTHYLEFEVNGSMGPIVSLEGCGAIPFILLPELAPSSPRKEDIPQGLQGSFFMQPTSIGLSTSRNFILRNASRLPLRFEVRLPINSKRSQVLTVSPDNGIIKGNQRFSIVLEFAPRKPTKSVYSMQIKVFPVGGSSNKVLDARQPGKVPRPECIQNISVSVVCPGEIGAIVFSPFRSSIPVQLIHTPTNVSLDIENISTSSVFYELFCVTEFIGESLDTNKLTTVKETFPLAKTNKLQSIPQNELTCESPSGNLSARSITKLNFVFHANREGNYVFTIHAKLRSTNDDGRESMIDNANLVLKRYPMMTNVDLSDLAIVAILEGKSSFPKLLFEDIRVDSECIISDINQLWRQFSLSSLNYDLSAPINDLTLSERKTYTFNFTPKPHYSSQELVYIQIRNHGSLAASFTIHYPNEQELELEPWVEEEEPTNELLMQTTIIDKLKCFSISPLSRILQPNETCVLSLKYSYDSLKYDGVHRLPLNVIIDKGRSFTIELVGRTIPVDNTYNPKKSLSTKSILLKHAVVIPFADQTNNCYLSSVAIGLPSIVAPEQRTELVNVSEVDVSYEIDINALDFSLSGISHDQNLVRIDNPKGIIAGLSSTFINWRFYPLEAMLYEFPLLIRYLPTVNLKIHEKIEELNNAPPGGIPMKRRASFNGKSGTPSKLTFMTMGCSTIYLQIKCLGYDPRQHFRPFSNPHISLYRGSTPSNVQLIEIPPHEQPAVLSTEALDFDIVPLGSNTARLFIIRNRISSRVVFSIEPPPASFGSVYDLFTFTPNQGILDPLSHVVVNVKCSSVGTPRIFHERIKIVIKEILGEDASISLSSKLNSVDDKSSSGKTDFKQKHRSVIVKSTAIRRIQVSEANVHEGRTATLPASHMVESDSIRRISLNSDINDTAHLSSNSGTSLVSSRNPQTSRSSPGLIKMQSAAPGSVLSTKGVIRKVGNAEYGPVSYVYLSLRGETNHWDVYSSLLVKAKSEEKLREYFLPVKSSESIKKALLTIGSTPMDILRPLTDAAVSEKIRKAKKEFELRDIAEYVLGDLLRSLMNHQDIGPHLVSAVTTSAEGLQIDGTISMPPLGDSLYGIYFFEIISIPLSQKFLLELHHVLGLAVKHPTQPNYLSKVSKDELPIIWIADINAILHDKRARRILVEDFHKALIMLGFSMKGAVYKSLVRTIKLQNEKGASVNILDLIENLPKDLQRSFAKTVGAAARKRRLVEKKLVLDSRLEETSMASKETESVSSVNKSSLTAEDSAAVLIQNSLRTDKAKAEVKLIQENLIEKESKMALVNRDGFLDIAAEILYNTMFNILDEASNGEFPIDAEPIRFAMSRSGFTGTTERF